MRQCLFCTFYFFYKKGLIIFIFIFNFCSFSFSQSLLIPFRDKNLWGYSDTNGIIKIKPSFDKADFFNYPNTITEVFKNNKISLLDIHGKLLFPFSDSYSGLNGTYIVTQNTKKGIYTKQGEQLVPFEFDNFEYTGTFDQYRNETNKVIGIKNNEYYLISLKTGERKQISKPRISKAIENSDGVMALPIDLSNATSVPNPQLQSSDFPKLKGYRNLVHCKTIYINQKPVFYVFCVWKKLKMVGYMGQNGVEFFKDRMVQEQKSTGNCSSNLQYLNHSSKDIELIDSCLLGHTIGEAIDKLGLDTSGFIPILMFAREVHGIYIRQADSCNITIIVDQPFTMTDAQLNAIESNNHFLNNSWKAIYKYILNNKIIGICWRKNKVRKVRVVGDMRYHDCWDR